MSKLQGILEMPGFNGFPSKASIENPQEEVSQPVYKFRRYLSNGQVWDHRGSLPYNPEFNYPEKSKFAFPQSKTSLQTGFASNPETIMFPNPDAGYKLNPEFKDAYFLSFKAREIAHDKERRERGHLNSEIIGDVTTNFVKEYMNTAQEAGEGELREKLRLEGFSDEEINEYIKKRKAEKIDYIAKNINKTDAVVHFMKGFDPDSGMDAAGISASSVVQNPLVQVTETPATKKARSKNVSAQQSILQYMKPKSDTASVASDPRSVRSSVLTRMAELNTLDLNI